ADADALHRLEIRGDAVARDIAVEPKPIDPWPSRIRRMRKAGFQARPGRRRQGKTEDKAGQEQQRRGDYGARGMRRFQIHTGPPILLTTKKGSKRAPPGAASSHFEADGWAGQKKM